MLNNPKESRGILLTSFTGLQVRSLQGKTQDPDSNKSGHGEGGQEGLLLGRQRIGARRQGERALEGPQEDGGGRPTLGLALGLKLGRTYEVQKPTEAVSDTLLVA